MHRFAGIGGGHIDWENHNVRNCEQMCHIPRMQVNLNMDMEVGGEEGRLPTSHPRRIAMRDAKMWRRETEREIRTGSRTSRCPCTLCMFGRPLLRSTQAKHLRDYGRHPLKRLQEEVSCLADCILDFANPLKYV